MSGRLVQSLISRGMTNQVTEDYGKYVTDRYKPNAFCSSLKCCRIRIGLQLEYNSKRGCNEYVEKYKNVSKIAKPGATGNKCNDCGQPLFWR